MEQSKKRSSIKGREPFGDGLEHGSSLRSPVYENAVKHQETPSLMYKVRLGEPRAFVTLCQIYIPTLEAFFFKKTHDHQIAEDLTQDVFQQVWEKRKDYQFGTSDLSYLMGFARLAIKRHFQKPAPLNLKFDEELYFDSVVDNRSNLPTNYTVDRRGLFGFV